MTVSYDMVGLALRLTFASVADWFPNPPFLRLELAAVSAFASPSAPMPTHTLLAITSHTSHFHYVS